MGREGAAGGRLRLSRTEPATWSVALWVPHAGHTLFPTARARLKGWCHCSWSMCRHPEGTGRWEGLGRALQSQGPGVPSLKGTENMTFLVTLRPRASGELRPGGAGELQSNREGLLLPAERTTDIVTSQGYTCHSLGIILLSFSSWFIVCECGCFAGKGWGWPPVPDFSPVTQTFLSSSSPRRAGRDQSPEGSCLWWLSNSGRTRYNSFRGNKNLFR